MKPKVVEFSQIFNKLVRYQYPPVYKKYYDYQVVTRHVAKMWQFKVLCISWIATFSFTTATM